MAVGGQNHFGKSLIWVLFVLVVLIMLASYLLILLMGYGFVFFTPQGLSLAMQSSSFPVLLFFFIGFYTPTELNVGAVFSFMWIVYVLCFAAAWRWRESFHDVIRKPFSRPFRKLFSNFLVVMPLLSSMLFAAAFAIIYSQESVGIPTGQPAWPQDTPLQQIFIDLAYAPVIEEVGFRIIPFGLVVILSVISSGKSAKGMGFKSIIGSIIYPEGAKRTAGLRNVSEHGFWRGISLGEWIMILVTSLVFGFAHVISGIGWEPGKATSASVQGFFFALTYLAYGFEAPILLHWFFNYYLFFFDPDVVSRFFLGADPILSVVELIIIALGVIGWVAFAVLGLGRLLRRIKPKQEMPLSTLPS